VSAVDQLNVATANFIRQNSKRLVDNVFRASPFEEPFRRANRIAELTAVCGSRKRAIVAVDVMDAFRSDDD
jgi:hypothetical protein